MDVVMMPSTSHESRWEGMRIQVCLHAKTHVTEEVGTRHVFVRLR